MALVRCSDHGKPKAKGEPYVDNVRPIGFPDTAAICGSVNCQNPGLIWLKREEKIAYDRGERFFRLPSGTIKVGAE